MKQQKFVKIVSLTLTFCFSACLFANPAIVVSSKAHPLERYAAQELQRYLYQATGQWLDISADAKPLIGDCFLIGQWTQHQHLNRLVQQGLLDVQAVQPQGYRLKTIRLPNKKMNLIAICSNDPAGVLYGVYGLLDDYYDIGFYFSGDVLPEQNKPLWLNVDEVNNPTMHIRGFLPWTNFPQSATSYSWQDWKYVIDQTAKMRMNFILIHNYNFGHNRHGHNEMFHNFRYKGYLSRVWMPTARTGHLWGMPGWAVNEYLFGAKALFDDYDFGADCALHNENLTNEQVFAKGVAMFQRILDYAHSRAVKIGLGLDIDWIPEEYKAEPLNGKAADPELVTARIDQIISDYPNLDYLICFHSESKQEDPTWWRRVFDIMYENVKRRQPTIRLAVAGWGLRPDFVADLPADVICAPISGYSDSCESGAIYGDREFWGCPWLERDFNSSQYYYPYNMHLSNTIKAYQNRAPNMKGFYCLTWRLTDAIDPKMSYIAKAPWDVHNKYTASEAVYGEYARRNYGDPAAAAITPIINENEPFASDFAECNATPPLYPSSITKDLFIVKSFKPANGQEMSAAALARKGRCRPVEALGEKALGNIFAGSWAEYKQVDFGQESQEVLFWVFRPQTEGMIRIQLADDTKTLLGTARIAKTDAPTWFEARAAIAPTSGKQNIRLQFYPEIVPLEKTDWQKAKDQIAIVDQCIQQTDNPLYRQRLGWLKARLEGVRLHLQLNHHFQDMKWSDLPGDFEPWTKSFTDRVVDISSLGNVVSFQNRFVRQHYVPTFEQMRAEQTVPAARRLEARGTATGAILRWQDDYQSAASYHIYRNGQRITKLPVWASGDGGVYEDVFDGAAVYQIQSNSKPGAWQDRSESPLSVPARCLAGNADTTPPQIVVISPPRSALRGQPIEIVARTIDNRDDALISAVCFWRSAGDKQWVAAPMPRRTKAIFAVSIAPKSSAPLIEWYLQASDGANIAVYPANAPRGVMTTLVIPSQDDRPPAAPARLEADKNALVWRHNGKDVWGFLIYRAKQPDFVAGPATFVTYVAANTLRYEDFPMDFDGNRLNGVWYYKVRAVDQLGNASQPTEAVSVAWQGGCLP